MKRLFNRSFFKLSAGFIGIVTVSLLAVLAIGSFEIEKEYQATADTAVDPTSLLPTN